MENLDNVEKNTSEDSDKSTETTDVGQTSTDADKSTEVVDSGSVNTDSQQQNQPAKKTNSRSTDNDIPDPDFYDIDPLDFRKTPQRNKELHRFRNILNAPCINIPLLVVERQEDILPLLSIYLQEEKQKGKDISFFSVTPSDFDMDDESAYNVEKKINFGGTVVENQQESGAIPVYCDLVDYMECDIFGRFSINFLRTEMPAVLCVRKEELAEVRQEAQESRDISGGIENPQTPYEPTGLARSKEIEISPLTREEKHIYFAHHINRLMSDNGLTCPPEVCTYFVNQMLNRFSHQDVFFKVFDAMNQAIVVAQSRQQQTLSKALINQLLKEYMPLHSRTKSLMDLDTRLKQKIYGQDQAIETCYETILADLDDENRTKPTVLAFFGPSGVGKTALAEEISLALTGQKVAAINMAEYSDSFKSSILTGSSKGYVNSEEDGLLAKIVKDNPRAVILLDEFEKAHPEVQQLFLGIFDKGSAYDNHSGQLDMSQTTIILTSNAGIRPNKNLGFGVSSTKEYVADKDLIKDTFPPELLGRLDAKILFNPLTRDALEKIVDKFMAQLKPRFDKLGIRVFLSPEAKRELIEKAQDPATGARPILSLIRQKIKTPIEIGVLKKRIKRGSQILVQKIEKKEMRILPKSSGKTPNLPPQNTNA